MRLGIIGTGRIAERFVPEANTVQEIQLAAVYHPRIAGAAVFASKWEIPLVTDDWEEFCEAIEGVYIASPHGTHVEYTKRLLKAGKHVLCEKPMCFSAKEADELFALAEANELVLLEAVKTAYCSGFKELIRIAQSGVIGEIKDVEACFTKLENPDGRELNSEQYGGSFYELGTYVILPAIKLLGKPKEVFFQSIYAEGKMVDGFTKAHLVYENAYAMAKTGLTVKSEGCLIISGTKGYIYAEAPWWLTKRFEVRYEDTSTTKKYEFEFAGQGLRYEIQAFVDRIQNVDNKEINNVGLSKEDSIRIAGVMERFHDKIR